MEYSFEFSAWIINFYYASWLNETSWDEAEPDSPNVDDCETPMLLSPTLAIWLVLVPALASAAQLPGSVLYHGHATFYRLSPVSSLADCLATYVLAAKALLKGHSWRQSIAGILLVRQGIGQDYLWWRKFNLSRRLRNDESACRSEAEDEDETAALAPTESLEEWPDHDDEELHLRYVLARITEPVPIERIAGCILILFVFSEAIALVVLLPAMSLLKTIAVLGLAHTGGLFLFEMLAWGIKLGVSRHSIVEIPWGSAIELLCTLDPGDGPLSLTRHMKDSRELDSDIELESCHSQESNDSWNPEQKIPQVPGWSMATKLIVGLFGVIESSVWILVTYAAWVMKPQVLFPAAVTAILINLSLIINFLFPRVLHLRLEMIQWLDAPNQERNKQVRVGLAALRWLLAQATMVNFSSLAWLGLMVAMIGLEKAESWPANQDKESTALPQWLIWVG